METKTQKTTATNENLMYQAILMHSEYSQSDIDFAYSIMTPEEKEKVDKYRLQLKREFRRWLLDPVHKPYFEQKIIEMTFLGGFVLIDISCRQKTIVPIPIS